MVRKVKQLGQVYTPRSIVNDVLDSANYMGVDVLRKHIMENSCGTGAFLMEIVERYIKAFNTKNESTCADLKRELEQYVHAIDICPGGVTATISKLDNLAKTYGLYDVNWDVKVADTLSVKDYDGRMDFVIGNPPYIRVHNLDSTYNDVKKYRFARNGMTDMYIVFFEIGLNMLRDGGVLSYITANSYFTSVAGAEFRNYIEKTQSVYEIMDLGHYNPFEETTYTAITSIIKGVRFDSIKYHEYNPDDGSRKYIGNIPYSNLFINGCITLLDEHNYYKEFLKIRSIDRRHYPEISVKNGFATLADRIFIMDKTNNIEDVIDVYKGSTGDFKKCIYPYTRKGDIIPFNELGRNTQKYLEKSKDTLLKRSMDSNSDWYGFGRTQAIRDVYSSKVGINVLIRTKDTLKIKELDSGTGVYSGLYILSEFPLDVIETTLKSDDFIKYVRNLRKYKNGGYFTFNSVDLNKYLIYKLLLVSDIRQV